MMFHNLSSGTNLKQIDLGITNGGATSETIRGEFCNRENLNCKPGEFEMKPDRKCQKFRSNNKNHVEIIKFFGETRPQQTVLWDKTPKWSASGSEWPKV